MLRVPLRLSASIPLALRACAGVRVRARATVRVGRVFPGLGGEWLSSSGRAVCTWS